MEFRSTDHLQKIQPAGNYARGCAAIMDQQGLRGQGTQGSWHQGGELNVPNMPTVHINKVSSYFVVGEVFETPVSFLVDMGAGVSLLQGDIWDRLVPETMGWIEKWHTD